MASGLTYRVAEIALRVDDLDRAVTFYTDVMGFKFHKEEAGAIFLEIGALDTPLGEAGHPQLLALFSRGAAVDHARSTFDHMALEIPHDRYDAELKRYADMGMVIRERSWPDTLLWRGRSFFFRDPEGNVIELIAHLPD